MYDVTIFVNLVLPLYDHWPQLRDQQIALAGEHIGVVILHPISGIMVHTR